MLIFIVSLIVTIILFTDIKFLFKKGINIFLICNIMFYTVQVLPYIILNLSKSQDEFSRFPVVYSALTDKDTNILYCLFILIVSILLSRIGKKYHHYLSFDLSKMNINFNKFFKALLGLFVLLPAIAVLLAPTPSIYFEYSYFYSHSYSITGAESIFHRAVITPLNYIAVLSILSLYYVKYSYVNKYNYLYILMFLISWIDGKRAIPIMFLFGVLAIDIIKKQKTSKTFFKGAIFSVFIVFFFVFHSNYTGKTIEDDAGFFVYETYFSRMSCAMTAIYDVIHGWEMLDYHGQSVLFTVLFFVPRSIWPNKPIMFCKYYTHYATGIDIESTRLNLLVNSWTEYIANFGFIGPFIVIYLYYVISKYSVKTNNPYLFLLGLIFCVFYTVFGFELLANVVVILWALLYIKVKMKRTKLLRHKHRTSY